jgi:hypothetical protein
MVFLALWFRRGVSLAILLVATIATAAAAGGAMYLRAGGESVLRDALVSAPVSASGIDVASVREVPHGSALSVLLAELRRGPTPSAYPRRVLSLTSGLDFPGPHGPVHTRLMWREGMCEHLRVVSGRCPTAPKEALISVRAQRTTGLRLGSEVTGSTQYAGTMALRVVGTYSLPGADPYWFDGAYFEAHAGSQDSPDILDTTFLGRRGIEAVPRAGPVTAEAQFLLDPRRVRLDDEAQLRREVTAFRDRLSTDASGTQAVTRLLPVLDRADSDRRDLGRSVLVVTLQLVALAFVVLRLVVADGSEARGNEVALAKLRGYRAGPTLLLGLLEPLVLLVLAVPLGLLLADLGVRLLGAAVLAADTPVTIRGPSLLAAAAALAGGLVAAATAARRVLTRPVLEQWRRTGDVGTSAGARVVEALLGMGALVALVALVSHGALREGTHSALPLVVPLVLVVIVALVGVRLLPSVCRGQVPRTRGSSRIGPFLAVRAVARRPAGLRLAALLAVAIGLATFAVNGSLVAAGNRAERARTDVGADTVATVRTEGSADLRAVVRSVDPHGSWAMAAEVWLPFGGLRGSLLAVDTAALGDVAHWRGDFGPVPLHDLAGQLGAQAPKPLALRGSALAVDVTTTVLPAPDPALTAHATGRDAQARGALGTLRPGRHRYVGTLPACGRGCTLDGLVVPRHDVSRELTGSLSIVGLGDRVAGRWQGVPVRFDEPGAWHQQLVSSPASSSVVPAVWGVTWRFSVGGGDEPVLLRSALPWPLPVAVGAGLLENPAAPSIVNFDRQVVPVSAGTSLAVVPGAGGQGSLVDLQYARAAVPRFEEFVTQQVWLSSEAPPDALAKLRAAGLQVVDVRTSAGRRALLDRSAPALGLLLFAFAAAAAAVLAAGATAVALDLSGRRRSFELAAMLVVGASRRSLLVAAVSEQLLVLGTALVLGIAGGLGAALLVLPAVPELPDPGPPPLTYAPHLTGLLLFLFALTALVLSTAFGAALGLLRHARPELLREAAT